MITFDGIYVDDRLTDEEMYDVLAENITLDELKHIKINRAREEATTHLSEKYTTIYTEKLSRYAISILKSIRISDYDVSPYAVTYCGLYDKNKSTSKEQVSYFEHMIARNMFYLASPGDNTHSIILSDFIEFLREKNDLLFDLSWHENRHKPRES